jgi:hypothetical protein
VATVGSESESAAVNDSFGLIESATTRIGGVLPLAYWPTPMSMVSSVNRSAGSGLTVSVAVADLPLTVARTVAVPTALAIASPLPSMVAASPVTDHVAKK